MKALAGIFGGGKQKAAAKSAEPAGGAKKLFTPEMVSKATKDYTSAGTAKWNQILSNMGAGGGTGGGDIPTQIGTQAQALGSALSNLTDQSGYGADANANMAQILKGVEGTINPKYSVY